MTSHMVFLGPLNNGGVKMPFQKPPQVPLQPQGHITGKLRWKHGQDIHLVAEELLDGMRAGSPEGTPGGQGRD